MRAAKASFPIRIAAEQAAEGPVQKVVDNGGYQKRDGAAQQNKPGAAQDSVERRIIIGIRGNDAGNIEDETGHQIDEGCKNGDFSGCLGAKSVW